MREYKTLKALRAGGTVDIEGLKFKMIDGELQPGDLYIAERNTGPHLLTVRKVVHEETTGQAMHVNPTTMDYPFDIEECVKVELIEDAE